MQKANFDTSCQKNNLQSKIIVGGIHQMHLPIRKKLNNGIAVEIDKDAYPSTPSR